MYIEYYINSIDDKDEEIKNNIDTILKFPISGILAPFHQARLIKKLYPEKNIGCFIDYPMASGNTSRRIDQIIDAIEIDMNFLAITMPFHMIVNRKYNKFREDIKKNIELTIDKNINIRYVLEYRKFDHQLLTKICEILMQIGVDTIYPSTGFFLDSIEDNTIACAYLHGKTGIKTIVNGNIWKKNQLNDVMKIKPYGISFNQNSNFHLIDSDLYDTK